MKWFTFNGKKDSPTRISKSERGTHKSSGSRSTLGRGDGSSGHSGSRRRRRHSHSTSLPRDIGNRSYYAPPQGNFYPPNVVRPAAVNPYPGYFHNVTRAQSDYEENWVDEKGYAKELYRNQFLFFRPRPKKNAHNLIDINAGDGLASPVMRNVAAGQFWDNRNRHSAPLQYAPHPSNHHKSNTWNWGFQHRPISVTTIRRVSWEGGTKVYSKDRVLL